MQPDVQFHDAGEILRTMGESLWSADDAAVHLDTLCGPFERRGVAGSIRVGWRRGWSEGERFHQQHYGWPDCRAAYIEQAQRVCEGGGDVYIGFSMRVWDDEVAAGRRPRRSPPLLDGLHTMAFDLDEADKRGPDAIERLQRAGAMLVTSGSEGHVHAYLVSPEPLTAQALNERSYAIKSALGLDRMLDQGQVLRLAGSANYKPHNGSGAPVRIISEAVPSRYEQGLRDLVGDTHLDWRTAAPLEPWVGQSASAVSQGEAWHDATKGAKPGRPQGERRSSVPDRSAVAYGWLCGLWEAGYDEDEACRLSLWTAKHGDVPNQKSAFATVDKFSTPEALRWEVLSVYAKRDARASDVERANRPERRALFPAVPVCNCCTGGAS